MRFFFDNNLAPKLAHGLNQMVEPDHEVIHLTDKFPGNTEDAVWMRGLANEENLVIVTADVRIRRNPHEVKAWQEAGHTIFFSQAGMDRFNILGTSEQIYEVFPRSNHPSATSLTRFRIYHRRQWQDREDLIE